ncbi:UDP-2,3-diacylglucosamine diphosphatase [Aureispira]|nr:UDP-2,3-diacylglucosamine diphosphatase [Aureispira sp.]
MKKIYFASDFHLGSPNKEASEDRERRILRWLKSIEDDAEAIFLVGDIFDFWFEYKTVVPKGFIRLLGKLAEFQDKGIDIHFFVGNHDIWMFDYLSNELGITIHHHSLEIELMGKSFFIGHGDGLGPKDYGYKLLRKIFTNRFCQWIFKWIHPDIGITLANFSSSKSRNAQTEPEHYLGSEKEWLLQYSNYKLKEYPHIDYFIFGHRHLPLDIILDNKHSRYINLGDWFKFNTFVQFDGTELKIKAFENADFNDRSVKH